MSIRVTRFGSQPLLALRIGSGATSSFRNHSRAEQRKAFELRRANPVGSLTLLRSHHELWRLTTIQFLAYLSRTTSLAFWALYAIYRYSWSQGMIGISLMIVGIVTAVISGGLTGRMVTRFGEKRTLYIGQFFGASGMIIAGLAKTGAWLHGFNPDHLALEYFHAGGAKHDDSPRQRARTRRVAGRLAKYAFNHFHHRTLVVSLEFLGGLLIRKIGFTCRERLISWPAVCSSPRCSWQPGLNNPSCPESRNCSRSRRCPPRRVTVRSDRADS